MGMLLWYEEQKRLKAEAAPHAKNEVVDAGQADPAPAPAPAPAKKRTATRAPKK